jgi:hypothetical protein
MEILIENNSSSELSSESASPLVVGLPESSSNPEMDRSTEKSETTKTIKTPSYTMNAIRKYQEKNKEKINEYARIKKKERYANDPEFRENEKRKALERYYKRKQRELLASKNTST